MTVPVPPNLPDIEAILKTPPSQLPHNKQTEALHNREVWYQIYLPMLIGTLVILVAIGGIIFVGFAQGAGGAASVRLWADVSTVFVVAQILAWLLPVFLVIFGLALGLNYLIGKMPPYFKVAQDYTAWLAYKTDWAMKFVIEPMLQVKSSVASMDSFIKNIRKFVGR